MSYYRTDKSGKWTEVQYPTEKSDSWFEEDDVGYLWGAAVAVLLVYAIFW